MNKALVLVDIQNDYFMRVQSRLDAPEKAAAQAKQALEYFRKNNWPVIFVQHISLKENAQSFAPGTPGAEIYEGVAPLPEEKIIIKHEPSSFYETELKDALYAKGVWSHCGLRHDEPYVHRYDGESCQGPWICGHVVGGCLHHQESPLA